MWHGLGSLQGGSGAPALYQDVMMGLLKGGIVKSKPRSKFLLYTIKIKHVRWPLPVSNGDGFFHRFSPLCYSFHFSSMIFKSETNYERVELMGKAHQMSHQSLTHSWGNELKERKRESNLSQHLFRAESTLGCMCSLSDFLDTFMVSKRKKKRHISTGFHFNECLLNVDYFYFGPKPYNTPLFPDEKKVRISWCFSGSWIKRWSFLFVSWLVQNIFLLESLQARVLLLSLGSLSTSQGHPKNVRNICRFSGR